MQKLLREEDIAEVAQGLMQLLLENILNVAQGSVN